MAVYTASADRGRAVQLSSRAATAVVKAARALGRRTVPHVLTVAGLGCIDTGAFIAHPIAGFVVTGGSLLLLDWKVEG